MDNINNNIVISQSDLDIENIKTPNIIYINNDIEFNSSSIPLELRNVLIDRDIITSSVLDDFKPLAFPQSNPFILANTIESSLQHLKNDCIIPVFSKDNERTIAHQEFIESALEAVSTIFPHNSISPPEIRVSHQVKGRIPEAIHKNAKDLLDHEKTIYYERMAFIIKLPQIKDVINGNELSLTLGGVKII